METITAQVVVAHPDDCIIFARPIMDAYPEFQWQIVYLTYDENTLRGREISQYWLKRNISTVFLGYEDDWNYVKHGSLGFDKKQAVADIKGAINADIIITHNVDGDYGHPHHRFVHEAVQSISVAKVYFASTFNYNKQYQATSKINFQELPLHEDVIQQFQDRDLGLYIITKEADRLLNIQCEF
jgi:LmbE family N-acetylglucosaminyl deacetylase